MHVAQTTAAYIHREKEQHQLLTDYTLGGDVSDLAERVVLCPDACFSLFDAALAGLCACLLRVIQRRVAHLFIFLRAEFDSFAQVQVVRLENAPVR